jgi:hypothetical protein
MQVTPVDNTLKYLQENDNKFSQQGERVRTCSEQQTKEPRNEISETVSIKYAFKHSNTEKGLHEPNFTTLAKISEQERLE